MEQKTSPRKRQATRQALGPPKTMDDYLARLGDEQRAMLQKLRQAIKAAAPGAEECISYQLAAFRLNGRMLVAFGATDKHCALYLMSATTVEAHNEALQDYDKSKGTIRFSARQSLPSALVRKLVKARVRENDAIAKSGGV